MLYVGRGALSCSEMTVYITQRNGKCLKNLNKETIFLDPGSSCCGSMYNQDRIDKNVVL